MMKKRIIALSLLLSLLVSCLPPAYAHNANEHDRILERVLLGGGGVPELSIDAENTLTALKNASYLAIDQYNKNGKEKLSDLQKLGINKLPRDISEFDFSGNHTHRRYTHMGWDHSYISDRAEWRKSRKIMLLATVSNRFRFDVKLPGDDALSYDKLCNSFSALIYYVHILGDHEGDGTYTAYRKNKPIQMPLVRAHPGEDNPDIIYELRKHIAILFRAQSGSPAYGGLMAELDSIGRAARKIEGSTGGINSEAKFREYYPYVEKTINALTKYVPILLKGEPFFQDVLR